MVHGDYTIATQGSFLFSPFSTYTVENPFDQSIITWGDVFPNPEHNVLLQGHLGNEVGDPHLQELTSDSRTSNHTPFFQGSWSFRLPSERGAPNLSVYGIFHQNDHASTRHFQARTILAQRWDASWFGENLPYRSLLKHGYIWTPQNSLWRFQGSWQSGWLWTTHSSGFPYPWKGNTWKQKATWGEPSSQITLAGQYRNWKGIGLYASDTSPSLYTFHKWKLKYQGQWENSWAYWNVNASLNYVHQPRGSLNPHLESIPHTLYQGLPTLSWNSYKTIHPSWDIQTQTPTHHSLINTGWTHKHRTKIIWEKTVPNIHSQVRWKHSVLFPFLGQLHWSHELQGYTWTGSGNTSNPSPFKETWNYNSDTTTTQYTLQSPDFHRKSHSRGGWLMTHRVQKKQDRISLSYKITGSQEWGAHSFSVDTVFQPIYHSSLSTLSIRTGSWDPISIKHPITRLQQQIDLNYQAGLSFRSTLTLGSDQILSSFAPSSQIPLEPSSYFVQGRMQYRAPFALTIHWASTWFAEKRVYGWSLEPFVIPANWEHNLSLKQSFQNGRIQLHYTALRLFGKEILEHPNGHPLRFRILVGAKATF
jgi:hypothetical protein